MLKRNLLGQPVAIPAHYDSLSSLFQNKSMLSSLPMLHIDNGTSYTTSHYNQLLLIARTQQLNHRASTLPTTAADLSLLVSLRQPPVFSDVSRAQILRLIQLQNHEDALICQIQERALQEMANAPGFAAKTIQNHASSAHAADVQAAVDCFSLSLNSGLSAFSRDTDQPPKKRIRIDDEAVDQIQAPLTSTASFSTDHIGDDGCDQPSRKKDSKWLCMLERLKRYKAAHGDCIVPRGYSTDPRLASWVAEQRKQFKLLQDGKQSSITHERILLLEAIDFAWNAQEAAWARHMSDLKKFRKDTGHCHVPLNHPQFPKLGLWVKEQRRHYTLLKQGKPSHMTQGRADELDKVGFCWDTHEATWLERFRELSKFKEAHGNVAVPTTFAANPKLGTWVHHQRRQYKKFTEGKPCHITPERIRALESLGFVWFPRERTQSDDAGESSSDSDEDLNSLDFRPRKRQQHLNV